MRGCPVVKTFESVVDANPDHPAIVTRDRVVTFAELDGQANAIAWMLREHPGNRREPVALSIADPAGMVAAQLGTLKAGRPYAVVNPHFPADRRTAMLRLLRTQTVLCDSGKAAGPQALPIPTTPSTSRPHNEVWPADLAYVLFTSGSTGAPKGVAQSRADMIQNVRRHAPLRLSSADTIVLITADGVISAVSNLYIGLLRGATIAVHSFREDGGGGMLDWLVTSGVTVFYGFPSFLRQLAKATPTGTAPAVRIAYLGGEPVFDSDFEALGRLFPSAIRATGLNSTETGLTRLFRLPPGAPVPARIPLGGPVDGVDVAVEDDDRIVIRSPFVKPRLWQEDGLADLITLGVDGRAVYITNDRGEIDDAGNLVHLGRTDAMLKIRGFRVEPSEVEAVILRIDGVSEVGVIACPGDDGEAELAAVVAARRPEITPAVIRQHARSLLPPAMVPTRVIATDTLPRTANGKLNRQALTAIVVAGRAAATPGQPRGAAETGGTQSRLFAIWRTVLRTDHISPEDDFFTLGGTSISALSVIARVRKEFGVPVRLAVLFETPTLAALTEAVDQAVAATAGTAAAGSGAGVVAGSSRDGQP